MTVRRGAAILGADWRKPGYTRKVGAEMENVAVAVAIGLGVIVSLSAPVLVWAMVVAGLRRVAKENAPAERQSRVKLSNADA